MKAKKELSSQLNLLLTGMAVNGIAHLDEIENDLIQTEILLEEAIAKLNGSFMEMHGTLGMLMQNDGQFAEGSEGVQEQKERQAKLADEVDGQLDSMATGLQFQDMTSQLIGHVLSRIGGLRLMLGAFASVGPVLMQQEACEDMVSILEVTNIRLALQSRKLNGQLEKTVRQQHMDGGSIELF